MNLLYLQTKIYRTMRQQMNGHSESKLCYIYKDTTKYSFTCFIFNYNIA